MATKDKKEVKLSKRVKRCGYHKVEHSIDLFGSDKREKDHKSVWCKEAWREYHKARKAAKTNGPAPVRGQKVVKPAAKKVGKAVKQAKLAKESSAAAE